MKSTKRHTHSHVVHHAHHPTHFSHSSSKHHNRNSSIGHRTPSYGKGLNKLTTLNPVNGVETGVQEHVSLHSITQKPAGVSMQRSLSDGIGYIFS